MSTLDFDIGLRTLRVHQGGYYILPGRKGRGLQSLRSHGELKQVCLLSTFLFAIRDLVMTSDRMAEDLGSPASLSRRLTIHKDGPNSK